MKKSLKEKVPAKLTRDFNLGEIKTLKKFKCFIKAPQK